MDQETTGAGPRPDDDGRGARRYELRPVAWVESPLRERAQAPRQGNLGAPPAWLAVEPE